MCASAWQAAACSGGLPAAAEAVARAGEGWDATDQRYAGAALDALRRDVAAVVPHIAEQVLRPRRAC